MICSYAFPGKDFVKLNRKQTGQELVPSRLRNSKKSTKTLTIHDNLASSPSITFTGVRGVVNFGASVSSSSGGPTYPKNIQSVCLILHKQQQQKNPT